MSTVQSAVNGKTEPVAPPVVTIEQLQAQLAAVLADNAALRTAAQTPQAHVGATYKILEPSADGKYGRSLSVELASGGRGILGPRKKHLDIIEEVKSGRYEAFLTAHPEIK